LVEREELTRFESNVTPFAAARPLLEQCLAAQRHPPPKRAHLWLALAAGMAVVVAGLFVAHRHARASAERRVLDSSVAALASQPGIVVTTADWSGDRLRLGGLRDPLASVPQDVLAARGLPAASLQLAPYSSLDPQIVERRARRKLSPPQGASLALVGGVLYAHGVAPRNWIEQTRRLAPVITGIERYDDSDLRPQEAVEDLRNAAAVLERALVSFPVASNNPDLALGLVAARKSAQRVVAAARDANLRACLSVVGHADATGFEAQNQALSEARARAVVADLVAHGVPRELLGPVGAGIWRDAGSEQRARSVTFHVDVGCGAQ
jgi:OOP family OmpA-OmpF porin